jgi:hypothetical protein
LTLPKPVFICIVLFLVLINSFPGEKALSGTVVDNYGRSVSGVKICVYRSDLVLKLPFLSDMGQFDKQCTRTDRKGTYSIEIQEPQSYTIVGSKDNLRFIHHQCTAPDTSRYIDTLNPCGSLVFYIHKEKSELHDNILVSLKGTPFYSQTDRKGKVVLTSIPSGNYQATIISGKPEYHDVLCSLHIAGEVNDTFADTLWLSYIDKGSPKKEVHQEPGPVTPPKIEVADSAKPKKPAIQAIQQIPDTVSVKPVRKNTEKPRVNAGKDTIVGLRDAFRLRGTATIKEGKIIKMEWSAGKQPFVSSGDGSMPVIAPVKSGSIQCVFRATADNDSQATDTVIIQVRSSPPRLTVRGDSTAGIFDTIHLYGKSTDNGSVVSTSWDIGNTGQFTSTDDTLLTVPPSDNPPAKLVCVFRAIDDDGETSQDTHTVAIQPLWKATELPQQLLPRKGHALVRFNGSIWIIGGNHSDIWKSSDLKNWEKVTDAADFGSRYGHSVTVFNGYLFVIGGKHSEGSFANDIWKSSDGKNWKRVLDADFLRRHYHTVTEFKTRLWLIGGLGESDYESCLNDIWSSEDGTHWKPEVDFAPFSRRYSQGTGVINGNLVVVGGMYEGFTGTKNLYDIWSSPDGFTWKQTNEKAFSHDSVYFSYVQNDRRLWALGDYCKSCGNSKPFSVISTTENGSLWEDRSSSQPVFSRIFCATASFNSGIVAYPSDSRFIYQLR